MQTYTKKRIEIFVEAPALHRLLEQLDAIQVTGYTVFQALAGRGLDGDAWSRDGLAGTMGSMVSVVCLTNETKVDLVLETAYALVSRQIGIVCVSDVQVIRKDHF